MCVKHCQNSERLEGLGLLGLLGRLKRLELSRRLEHLGGLKRLERLGRFKRLGRIEPNEHLEHMGRLLYRLRVDDTKVTGRGLFRSSYKGCCLDLYLDNVSVCHFNKVAKPEQLWTKQSIKRERMV